MRIRLEHVRHVYAPTDESAPVPVLDDVSIEIPSQSFTVLVGPSGSGKSTLLNLIGAIDRPTSGRLWLGDTETSSMDERALTLVRRHQVGFVFQFFNLVPTLSVEENVGFPLALIGGVPAAEVRDRVRELLHQVGLLHRATHFPNELSGGEMQRVAIARAVVHRPPLLLADEPTGNLDSATGERILDLIRAVHETHRPTIVMATHSERAASFGQTILTVSDGRVTGQRPA